MDLALEVALSQVELKGFGRRVQAAPLSWTKSRRDELKEGSGSGSLEAPSSRARLKLDLLGIGILEAPVGMSQRPRQGFTTFLFII